MLSLINPFKKNKKRKFFEGGKITKANMDFHNANAPFEDLASPDRDTMRARARWLSANNPIMSNIDETITNNVVGKGIRHQSKTGFKEFDKEIEGHFKNWVKECDITGRINFYDMQSIILRNRMVDGEVFINKLLLNNKKYPLRLQLIEADRISNRRDTDIINGIKIGDHGQVLSYLVKTGNDYDIGYKEIPISTENMINYFKMERPSQYRGISEYKQIILDMKNFMAFQSATIAATRARANIGYIVKTNESASVFGSEQDEEFEQIQEINGIMVHYLNQGEDITKLDPDVVSGQYQEFVNSVIHQLATGRGISYELAFRDFSQVNFSSARASIIQDNKRFDKEQQHLIDYVLTPIYEDFVDSLFLNGVIKSIPANKYFQEKETFLKPKWITPAREWVDPLKDIKAITAELELKTTTLTEVAARKGQDLEELLQDLEKEKELLESYGLTHPSDVQISS